MSIRLGFLLFFIAHFKICQSVNYANYSLIKLMPQTSGDMEFLRNLEAKKYIDVKFWERPLKVHRPVFFIINPLDFEVFRERANHFRLSYWVVIKDIQTYFNSQVVGSYLNLRIDSFSFNEFHELTDIYQLMSNLVRAHSYIKKINIGKSAEGRDIYALSLNKNHATNKVVVEGGIHGHEWLSVSFVLYLLNQLVHSESASSPINIIAMNYEWLLVPVVNPDGYEYCHKQDRLWRKNRNKRGNSVGVDLNRNFDISFRKYASSEEPNDDNFAGPLPFSEPETRALANLTRTYRYGLRYYFSFHSYGQLIVIPYEDRILHVENFSEMENYARQAVHKIYTHSKVKYKTGTIYDTTGTRISGTSTSWMKKVMKVPYVYAIYLRDSGILGHAVPSTEIVPSCEEGLIAVGELMTARPRNIRSLYGRATFLKSSDLQAGTPNTALYVSRLHYSTTVSDVVDYVSRKTGCNLRVFQLHSRRYVHFASFVIDQMYDVNFWKSPGQINMPVEFTLSPNESLQFTREANKKNIYFTTILKDVQRAFDNQTVKVYIRRNMDSFDWRSYFRLADIYNWLQDVAKQHPGEVTLFSIGKTLENRDIMAVKLLLKEAKVRSKVIIEGGIHAREWISSAFVTYFLNELVRAPHSKDKELKDIALSYEWYIVPVINPDGYEYTHTTDRLWRKNRHGGYGVDINRNFDAAFGSVGVSKHKKSEQYCGPKAFTENESKAMSQFIRKNSEKLEYYFAFHSYGQLLILPYAYTTKHLDNFKEVKKIADRAAKKIKKRHGTKYKVGTAYDTVGYMAAGVSGCWAKKTFKIPIVATFELRDEGGFGFALPPDQILPTCLETMDGMKELLKPRKKLRSSADSGHRLHVLDGLIMVLLFNVVYFI